MKIGVWHESMFMWRPAIRPSMFYHVIFTILTLYLPVIKKIMLISHFGAVKGCIERNIKNHRFLEFRLIFGARPEARNCSKWLKIVQQAFNKLKIMNFDPKAMIFYCGE